MKKTIISSLIIFICLNLNAQTENDIFKHKGIVALFEKKTEYIYDVVKEDFDSEKLINQRTLLFLSDKEIVLDNQKYKIQNQTKEKEYDKASESFYDFIEYTCLNNNDEEYIIEMTRLDNVIYGVRVYFWGENKKLYKISYKH